ncbi:MAG: hypothetical protein ACKVVT_11855 [Dehalococcoidia bacterium]
MAVKQRVTVKRVRPKHRQQRRAAQATAGSARNVFATGVAFSVVGAGVFGSTLAWQSDQTSGPQQVNVGALDWDLDYVQREGAFLGPNGNTTAVGLFNISNLGDFNLGLPDELNANVDDGFGEVIVSSVDVLHASCDVGNFSGRVVNTSFDDSVAPGEVENAAGRVDMHVAASAPEACIGAEVSYQVRVVVFTTTNGAP